MPIHKAFLWVCAAFQIQLWSPMAIKGSEKNQLFYMMCTEAGTDAEGKQGAFLMRLKQPLVSSLAKGEDFDMYKYIKG